MPNLLRASLLASCLVGFSSVVQAQTVADKMFGVRPSNGNSQRVVTLGDSKNRVIQVLGPPTKTSRYYAETENAWATVLYYGANRFDFTKNALDIVELSDARFTVGKPGTPGFRVGSALPKEKPAAKPPLAFGSFRVNYKPGTSHNLPYSAISSGYMKTEKGQALDVLYEIHYDQQGRVSHIFLDQSYD